MSRIECSTQSVRTARLLLTVLAGRRVLRRRDSWSREQLLGYQARSLARLRAHAYARSPFYARFHAGKHAAPLSELPVLTKTMLMDHLDDLVTARDVHLADLDRYLGGCVAPTTASVFERGQTLTI